MAGQGGTVWPLTTGATLILSMAKKRPLRGAQVPTARTAGRQQGATPSMNPSGEGG